MDHENLYKWYPVLVYLTLCTFLFKLYVTSKVTWLFWCIWAWVWPDLHRLQWVYLHADAHYSKFVALYVSIGARGQMYVWTNLLLRSFALSFFLPFFLSFFRLFVSSAVAGMVLCYLFFSDDAVSVHPVGRMVITMILHFVIFIALHLFVASSPSIFGFIR